MSLAKKQNITIKKLIIYNNDNKINEEISSFTNTKNEIYVPNKRMSKVIYNVEGGSSHMEIDLFTLLFNGKFPGKKIKN